MIYYSSGSVDHIIDKQEIEEALFTAFDKTGRKKKVLAVPPDHTRIHSRAGDIIKLLYKYYRSNLRDILPALGTHVPMTSDELKRMFGDVPEGLFRVHDWRNDVLTVGEVPGEYVSELTAGALDYSWPAQLNKLVYKGGHDLIISTGQVVPHEVIGMANYNKNLFVGTGGHEGISKSHFIGAVYGMEKLMGKASNPVRSLLNYASERFINHLPVIYILTVIGRDNYGNLAMKGLYIGDDEEVFRMAAGLSLKLNFEVLEEPVKKAVVYLDPEEFRTTWVGNKSIYRTRMAMADNGELIVLAPGVKKFGEDKAIDALIRKYGYRGTPATLKAVRDNEDLKINLSAAAHFIHGSTEGRFSITYCPGYLSREEIESVGFNFGNLEMMMKKYDPGKLLEGYNTMPDGERIFFISNPALGLWTSGNRLQQ